MGTAKVEVGELVDLMAWSDFYAVNNARLEHICVERIAQKLSSLPATQVQTILKVRRLHCAHQSRPRNS